MRKGLIAFAVVAIVLGLALLDAAFTVGRVERFSAPMRPSNEGVTTYLLVGSDRRTALDSALDQQIYADPEQEKGERADVMVLLRRDSHGARALAVPRDYWVGTARLQPNRLGMALNSGPAALVDSYCKDLQVSVDHMVIVDFLALRSLVDAVGGVDITTDTPVRDPRADLSIEAAGRHHLNGRAALAWARSRHPEVLVNGQWQQPSWFATSRHDHQGQILTQVMARLDGPVVAQRAMWNAAPHVRTDANFGVRDWYRVVSGLRSVTAAGPIPVLPNDLVDGEVPVAFPVDRSFETIEQFSSTTCTSESERSIHLP